GQLCRFYRSVPVGEIAEDSLQLFSISCSRCNGIRASAGSQTQSWACVAARDRASVFSSVSITPRKNQDRSGHLCACSCALVIFDFAQVSPRRQRTKSV